MKGHVATKKASISTRQPVDGWLSLGGQRACQKSGFDAFIEITYTYLNNDQVEIFVSQDTYFNTAP